MFQTIKKKKTSAVTFDVLWSGSGSPLFGRDRMTTFERYFIEDKTSHHEEKNAYYDLIETEDATNRIFEEFGLDGTACYKRSRSRTSKRG